jgi:PTS system nitrogen regulatory IIA component
MQISEIISPDKISCHVHASSKKGALEELSKLIASDTSSLVYTEIFDCFNARERLGSTGLGNGVAIPHGRLKEINQPVAAFIQLDDAIEYDAVDQKPVDLIFGLLVPEDSTEEHLQILAKLASLFSDSALVKRLREGDSPEKLYETLNN